MHPLKCFQHFIETDFITVGRTIFFCKVCISIIFCNFLVYAPPTCSFLGKGRVLSIHRLLQKYLGFIEDLSLTERKHFFLYDEIHN